MPEINNLNPAKVTFIDNFAFKVDIDTTKFGSYTKNGYATQVKVPQVISHKSYTE